MPTERVYSGHFQFTDVLRREGTCELDLYQLESGAYLAIVTDIDQGPRITTTTEKIATLVRRRFLTKGDALLWVEHYRQQPLSKRETYDKVFMHWDGQQYVEPRWKPSTKQEVERLIGRRLEE